MASAEPEAQCTPAPGHRGQTALSLVERDYSHSPASLSHHRFLCVEKNFTSVSNETRPDTQRPGVGSCQEVPRSDGKAMFSAQPLWLPGISGAEMLGTLEDSWVSPMIP